MSEIKIFTKKGLYVIVDVPEEIKMIKVDGFVCHIPKPEKINFISRK